MVCKLANLQKYLASCIVPIMYFVICEIRHPEARGRPSFNDVSTRLSVSNSKLLHVDKSDDSFSSKLGANLACGEGLYDDLQRMYKM